MRRLVPFAIATVLVLLALVAWRSRPAETPTAQTPAAPAAAASLSGDFSWTAPVALPHVAEVIANARCFEDLLAIDQAGSFDAIRLALQKGVGQDALAADFLRDKTAELIGSDVDKALEVLSWARTASPEHAAVLLAGLAQSAGGKDARVGEGLLSLSEAGDVDGAVRAAALDALRTQPKLSPEGQKRLKTLALQGASDELAWHATRALGSVMNEHHGQGGDFEPYWDELHEVATTSMDPAVRALALEAPMHSDTILPADKIPALTELMLNEPDRDVRELAAFQLGLTEDPQAALEAFRRAFDAEYDLCVRWAIVRFAVRAGGVQALPLLEYFASVEPAFAADLADFRALFAAGHRDFEQIWLNKPERHACVVEDGELHGPEEG